MRSSEERKPSPSHALLRAMGVSVWYLRDGSRHAEQSVAQAESEPAPVVTSNRSSSDPLAAAKAALRGETGPREPAPVAEPEPQVPQTDGADTASTQASQLAFSWVRGATGMVLAEPGISAQILRALKDLVAYVDWRSGHRTEPAHGQFLWPQLVGSSGTPQRAMAVFVDKHLPRDKQPGPRWVAVFEDVADQFEGWHDEVPADVILLPGTVARMGDAQAKKAIWRSMQKDA